MITYKMKFAHGSLADFNDGIQYYDKISRELGDKFLTHFWEEIDKVKAAPLHYQKRYKSIRIAFMDTFPFGIHFTVEKDEIIIFRILHTKRFLK